MTDNSALGNLLVEKFVQEEIMTKSEFEARIDAIMDKHEARIDIRFQAIDIRFQAIDVRFEAIDTKFQAIDAKFQAVDARFESMEARFNRQFLKIEHRLTWLTGLIVTMGLGLGGIMLKLVSMVMSLMPLH